MDKHLRVMALHRKLQGIIPLDYPRTVCTSDKCIRVLMIDGEQKVDYISRCHSHCYLKGVEQEVIHNPILKHCTAMNRLTGSLYFVFCYSLIKTSRNSSSERAR